MVQHQKAFVLLKIDPGHEKKVLDDLLKIPEVDEAHIVPGVYDVLAIISSKKNLALPGDERIYWIVLEKINKIKHIRDSQTLIPQLSKYRAG
jgi:DNA-binding Lrp family transcriptional regulator